MENVERKMFEKSWAKIVAKAWEDEAFKKRLLQNPNAVVQENGITVPEGVNFLIHENNEKENHLSLPRKPKNLSEDQLKDLAAGNQDMRAQGCACCCG